MPTAVLRIFEEQVEKLRAQECLMFRLIVASGSATLAKDDQARVYEAWRKSAGLTEPPARVNKVHQKARLAAIGIGVQHV